MAFSSMEFWNMSLHDLDRAWLPEPIHKFHHLAREYHQLGSNLV